MIEAHHQTHNGIGLGSQWETSPGGASDVSVVFYKSGWTAVVPNRGVPGKGGDMNKATRKLFEPPHVGHHDNHGRGKPPPPTVSPLKCDGAMRVPKRPPPQHHLVRQIGGAEAVQDYCGVGYITNGELL